MLSLLAKSLYAHLFYISKYVFSSFSKIVILLRGYSHNHMTKSQKADDLYRVLWDLYVALRANRKAVLKIMR